MATDDGEARPGREAQDPAGHLRESASGPGPSDGPKKSGCLVKLLTSLAIAAAFYGLYWIVVEQLEVFAGDSEASSDSASVSTVADPGAAPTESASGVEGSASDSAGPISGTWAMYWEGSDNQAFTVTFIGSDTGTLEIHNDDTEVETAFEVDGDQVWFKFTRTFKVEAGDWKEGSTFKGTLTGLHEMTGTWARQDWECSPESCKYGGKWTPYDARLIRVSE